MPIIQPNFDKFKGRAPDTTGFLEVTGAWKEGDDLWAKHSQGYPEAMKMKFYNQKILHLLFPKNFPDFTAAGVIGTPVKSKHGYTIRDFVDLKESTNSELELSKGYFANLATYFQNTYRIHLDIDISNNKNFGKDREGNNVYLDTNDTLVRSQGDFDKLMDYVRDQKTDNTKTKQIEIYAKQSLENFRQFQITIKNQIEEYRQKSTQAIKELNLQEFNTKKNTQNLL